MQKKKRTMGLLTGLCLLLAGTVYSCSHRNAAVVSAAEEVSTAEAAYAEIPSGTVAETAGHVWVHVCGAVQQEGVYELPSGSRYQQAVEAAGGFSAEADTACLNLAALVSDGEQIRVLTRAEAAAQKASEEEAADGLVNINTASREELMSLPGIGEARAEAIIAYREAHGEFQSIEDIMLVSGIKEAAFSKLKAKIKVGTGNGEQGFSSG